MHLKPTAIFALNSDNKRPNAKAYKTGPENYSPHVWCKWFYWYSNHWNAIVPSLETCGATMCTHLVSYHN